MGGFLVTASDVLRLDFIEKTSPSAFHVLINLRSLVLTWIWMKVMNKELLGRHWVSIAGISFGCFVKELPHLFAKEDSSLGRWDAYLELLGLMVCTSTALVANELLLKGYASPPLNFQNLALYGFGIGWLLLEGFAYDLRDGKPSPVFQGSQWKLLFTPLPLLAVCSFTCLGLITSYFLKKLSNVAKEVATGVEVLVSVPLDTIIFKTPLGICDVFGSGLVLGGVAIFARWPLRERQRTDPLWKPPT